ncbi:MAG: GntR family transcriptional regulator [Pseudodonghicola sp.]
MTKSSKRNLRDVIYEDYLRRIQYGQIAPEDRLVDTAIAAEQNMSRMPVRDALMRLAHEGYLETTTRGFMLPSLTRTQVLELFEIRRLLEPRAVALATCALSDEALERMKIAVDQAASTIDSGDVSLFYKASEMFRNEWLEAVPNEEMKKTIQRYLAQVQTVRMATMRDDKAHRVIVAGQRQLLDAFLTRDAVRAQDIMLRFVLAAEDSYLELSGT